MTDHPPANGTNGSNGSDGPDGPDGDLRDRLMDVYLADVVGDVEPPDLSAQIVAALQAGHPGERRRQRPEGRFQPRTARNAIRRPPMNNRISHANDSRARRDDAHRPPLARLITTTVALLLVAAALVLAMLHDPAGIRPAGPDDNSAAGSPDSLPGRDDAAVVAAFPDDWRDLLEQADRFELLDLSRASGPVVSSVSQLQTNHQLPVTDPVLRRAIVATVYTSIAGYRDVQKTDGYRDLLLQQKKIRDDLAATLFAGVRSELLRAGKVRTDFGLRHEVMRGFMLASDAGYYTMDAALSDVCRGQIAVAGFVEPDKWDADRTCTAFFRPPSWARPADLLPAYREWLARELTTDDYRGFGGEQPAERFAGFKQMREWARQFLDATEQRLKAELDKVAGTLDVTTLANPAIVHGIRATAADGRAIELVCYDRVVFVRVGERVTCSGVRKDDLEPALAHLLINGGFVPSGYERSRPVARIAFSQPDPVQHIAVNDRSWLVELTLDVAGRAEAKLWEVDGSGEIVTRDVVTDIGADEALRVFAAIRGARLDRQDLRDNNVPVDGVPVRNFTLFAPDGSVVNDLRVLSPAAFVYRLTALEAALHAVIGKLEPQVAPDRADDSLQRFEFHSGGADHPEGYGEWQVVYNHADYSLGFSLWRGEKVLQYPTVKLTPTAARQLLQLVDAAGFPRRRSTDTQAAPGSIRMTFIRTSAAGPHEVSLWESEAVNDDAIRVLLQHLKKLIHTHTQREPVFRTDR